mmetsp:Transcript_28865/g.44378  ORF Transcript_28865/g.44378 Transcript_28865/m.44378 type:complete len:215 (-) Transcript_28865:2658-3302(-)
MLQSRGDALQCCRLPFDQSHLQPRLSISGVLLRLESRAFLRQTILPILRRTQESSVLLKVRLCILGIPRFSHVHNCRNEAQSFVLQRNEGDLQLMKSYQVDERSYLMRYCGGHCELSLPLPLVKTHLQFPLQKQNQCYRGLILPFVRSPCLPEIPRMAPHRDWHSPVLRPLPCSGIQENPPCPRLLNLLRRSSRDLLQEHRPPLPRPLLLFLVL